MNSIHQLTESERTSALELVAILHYEYEFDLRQILKN